MGRITVAFNNVEGDKRLKTGWGSSVLVEQDNDIILFDTSPNAEDLFFNLGVLGVDKRKIRKIAISHRHPDHMKALERLLGEIPKNPKLYLPGTLKGKKKINSRIYIYSIKGLMAEENVLAIDSSQGLILIIGCAHPGIYRISKTIKDDLGKNVYAILGGFHFEYYPPFLIKIMGRLLKSLGVGFIGPNHCTGERAIKILKQIFEDRFLEFGCGQTFEY